MRNCEDPHIKSREGGEGEGDVGSGATYSSWRIGLPSPSRQKRPGFHMLFSPLSLLPVEKWRLAVEKNSQRSDNIEEYVLRGHGNEQGTFSGVQKAGIRKERS